MAPHQFVEKWKRVAMTERAAAQSYFLDLCAVLGHEDPVALNLARSGGAFPAASAADERSPETVGADGS
jgi:hypothetical protein